MLLHASLQVVLLLEQFTKLEDDAGHRASPGLPCFKRSFLTVCLVEVSVELQRAVESKGAERGYIAMHCPMKMQCSSMQCHLAMYSAQHNFR